MSDFMEAMADEVEAVEIPKDEQIKSLQALGEEFYAAEMLVRDLEAQLESAKEERKDIARNRMPDAMLRLNTDKLGLPDSGVDLVLSKYYHANIESSWEEERRESAFSHLTEDLDAGDLIKTTVTFVGTRGDYNDMLEFLHEANALADQIGLTCEGKIELGVAWNTLTAFVKEQYEKGTEGLDLERLGATVGNIVKVKKRK